MAIVAEIENEFGVKFKYHKIKSVQILNNDTGVQLNIVVDSYVNKQARKEGKKSIRTIEIINNADFALSPFYKLLKAKFVDFDGTDDTEIVNEKLQKPTTYTIQTEKGECIKHFSEEENIQEETND